jgi:hypothetical protein
VTTGTIRMAIALTLAGAAVLPLACAPVAEAVPSPSASPSAAVASPTATPIFVPSAKSYFPRIDRFDFPTAPAPFLEALTRGFGSEHQTFSSFEGRSIVYDGAQLPAVVSAMVVSPELYARTDTYDRLVNADLQGLPGSTSRPLSLTALQLPATEISLADRQSYAVVYLQGFFFVQVIGTDAAMLDQIAEVLVGANARRQP